MNWMEHYFDLTEGLFCFFTMELFMSYNDKAFTKSKKIRLRCFYLILTFIYAYLPSASYDAFLSLFCEFIYCYIVYNFKLKKSFTGFLKLEFYLFGSTAIIYILHSYIINDILYIGINALYDNYKSLICSAMSYLVLCLYLYGKRLLALHTHRAYSIAFSLAAVLAIFILSILSLQLVSGRQDAGEYLPIIFSFVFIIGAVFLTAYNQMIVSFEMQIQQKQLITKYELELKYYDDIDASMKKLSSLRHDFKNHLIVLSGYAQKGELGKLQQYIDKISTACAETKIIQTPNSLISSILNAKASACDQKGISFDCTCNFGSVSIPDFYLITIFGNILDNAITAAEKVKEGYIQLSILQADSFLTIACKNNHCETIRQKDDRFISTKETADPFHGIGIKNIQDATAERNGTVDIQYDSSVFSIVVLLPNYA